MGHLPAELVQFFLEFQTHFAGITCVLLSGNLNGLLCLMAYFHIVVLSKVKGLSATACAHSEKLTAKRCL